MLTTQICKRKQVAEAFPVSIIQIYDLHDAKQHEFDVSVQPETQVAHSETSWLLQTNLESCKSTKVIIKGETILNTSKY